MANKAKIKGNSWENTVAKHLTSLYGESFIRVPGSGAYVGGKNSVRKEFLHEGQIRAMKGDIIPPLHWKHFNVECKSYADFPFHQLFSEGKISLFENWISQTLDAADQGDLNIIIMKFNRKGSYIAFQEHHIPTIKTTRHITYYSEKFGPWAFTNYDEFWKLNFDAVRQLSQNKD